MAKKIVRKAEDAAGIGPYARERERLVPLIGLRGWNVIDGEADIRSWDVKTLSGKVLGSVRELHVDPRAGEAVNDRRGSRRVVPGPSGAEELARYSDEELSAHRDIRYADASGERVVERRPIVEETVVRRRSPEELDEPDSRL